MDSRNEIDKELRMKTEAEFQVEPILDLSPSTDTSSLQELLNSKLKKGLKPTSTKLTKTDGSILLLQNQGQDPVSESTSKRSSTLPQSGQGFFVVDTKPDLTIGKFRPWLFISSQDVPCDFELISQHRITNILSLLPGFELNNAVKPLIKSHLVLDVFDEINFDLNSPTIKDALDYIHDCRIRNRCLLVHCNAGISRAPSIVMLYLMKMENLDFDTAFQQVKLARPFAKPNEGFLRQLKSFITN